MQLCGCWQLFPVARCHQCFGILIGPYVSPSLLALWNIYTQNNQVWVKQGDFCVVTKHFWTWLCFFSPSPFLCRGHRLGPSDDEMYQRTTVSIMQKEPGSGALINSYSSQGFIIDGNRVLGPCAVLPPAILQWNVSPSFKRPSQWFIGLFK